VIIFTFSQSVPKFPQSVPKFPAALIRELAVQLDPWVREIELESSWEGTACG
jgi:hypothetical protein